MRIFLDANILFSAAQTDGAVRRLLGVLRQLGYVLVADAYVLAEARRNVQMKASAQARLDLEALLAALESHSGLATPALKTSSEQSAANWLPEKDRPVLIAAIALRCDMLLTGDKTHFDQGYGASFEGVEILSPAMLVKRLY